MPKLVLLGMISVQKLQQIHTQLQAKKKAKAKPVPRVPVPGLAPTLEPAPSSAPEETAQLPKAVTDHWFAAGLDSTPSYCANL